MNTNSLVYPLQSEFKCRCCAASHIPQSGKFDLCAACYDEFCRYANSKGMGRHPRIRANPLSASDFNKYLARRFFLDVSRGAKTLIVGRCEAAAGASTGWREGQFDQCRRPAFCLRDGRRVCYKHNGATSPVFVGTEAADPYCQLRDVMVHLANVDSRFRECLIATSTILAEAPA